MDAPTVLTDGWPVVAAALADGIQVRVTDADLTPHQRELAAWANAQVCSSSDCPACGDETPRRVEATLFRSAAAQANPPASKAWLARRVEQIAELTCRDPIWRDDYEATD